jgi:hypothetical protein
MAAVKKKKITADFMAPVVREFAQWLSLGPHLFALLAWRDGRFLSLHQVSSGGKTAGRESLPGTTRGEKASGIANPC